MKAQWYFWAVAAALIVLALWLGVDLNAVGRSLLWVKEFMP